MDRGAKTARTNAAAKHQVAKKPRAPVAPTIRELNTRLVTALEQQDATNEILRVMAASPGNVQPVLDAVARLAAQLCKAPFARVLLVHGDTVRAVADHSVDGETPVPIAPVVLKRTSITGRAVIDRETIHHADVVPLLANEFPDARENARFTGFRAVLAVPLIREAGAYGAIFLWRRDPGLFPPDQVALVQTFARQAAIAIDNARLFEEVGVRNRDLTEALEQQEATSEILRSIAGSPTEIQPVLETVVRAAARFCGARDVLLMRLDGDVLRGAAAVGPFADVLRERSGSIYAVEIPLTRGSVSGRAAVDRGVVHIHDLAAESENEYPVGRELQRRYGHRTLAAVPLLREGMPVGTIVMFRTEVQPFSDHQLELLATFAAQAVIAIENVRLFTELGVRNRDLTEALEQQTATSEILRAISRSPTDVQPVFDIIAQRVGKLCNAEVAVVSRFDGTTIELAAIHGLVPEGVKIVRKLYPMRIDASTITARVIRGASVVHIADVLAERDYGIKDFARAARYRGGLGVPVVRGGQVIGSIFVGRANPGFFTDSQVELLKTFSEQAVIAIENVRLFTELEARNKDLTESLEQQTATSEILRAISSSPTDVQPVFDIIGESAERLCDAEISVVSRLDGELIRLVAVHGVTDPGTEAIDRHFPMRLDAETVTARAVRRRQVIHVEDVLADPGYEAKDAASASSYRACLGVPMVREDEVIGAIFVARRTPGLFTDSQVQLLKTFADQAVIAIENVRLFTELEARNKDLTESLEQQTATSAILRAISSSPTDVQPVFDTIAASALRLCEAEFCHVFRFDGKLLHFEAADGLTPEGLAIIRNAYPMAPGRGSAAARSIASGAVEQIPDVLADPDYTHGAFAKIMTFRSIVAVPMLRDSLVVGSIAVARTQAGIFPARQIELLQTFADQAVIAVENVRLFTELGVRNRDLTEALEQQTATSEILRVISRSQTDVQPVFDTIAAATLKLCGASSANVFTFDGELIHPASLMNINPQYAEKLRSVFPRPPSRDTAATRAVLSCSVVAVSDVLEDAEYAIGPQSLAGGFRSVLAVPLVRERSPIGVIAVGRPEPGPFPDNQIALLQTFADQAVIAIENVRLFKELEARTTELTQSVGELKALGEIGQAVSSTLDLDTVLRTIVSRATELAGVDGGAIYEYDEAREEFYLRTAERYPAELVDVLRAKPIRKGEGALGRLAVVAEPVQIRDIADDRTYPNRVREILVRLEFRSALAIPLVRDEHLLGGLVVNRASIGEFAPQVIELLKTFASQSALAIQNARLFREIEDKGRQLEIASRHKSEFLANMSHELRTPLNAIIGFSEVLAERMFGEINDKQAEYLADILESGRHLLSLINDILDLSKIEAGRMELETADFSLPGAIDNAMTLIREKAQRRDVRLERAIDERVGTIRGDERKVKQVLLNLLSNALKFTPEGGRISVRAEVRDGATEVSVTDTGVGIAPEDQATVFEEFRQVGTTAKKVEGTGLGLAISRKFIELHGGRIWVTSEVGVGSTFAFTLPMALA